MTDPLEWKPQYAYSCLQGYVYAEPKLHHVSPHVPGRAHCQETVLLDMSRVLSAPIDGDYCGHCRKRQAVLKRYREARSG
jgi:hypothetical protein